jgi:hypothetical protein
MTADEPVRSSEARAVAELALVRVVHHYGQKPGFVLIGGLVPQLLCSNSAFRHAGTTDVDVQVDLEIARGATYTRRLEQALANAEFRPDSERIWRWEMHTDAGRKAQVKFELLADLEDQQQGAIVTFDDCEQLGAVNLRGTGYAARDVQEQSLRAKDGGVVREVQVNVSGLGGFLMAKAAAANGRNKPKDWYDIAYVLLHNDHGPAAGADAVTVAFGSVAVVAKTWLLELRANFVDSDSQGTSAYVEQFLLDHPGQDPQQLGADAMLAVDDFCTRLLS